MAIKRFSTSNLSGTKSSKLWDQITTPGTYESIAVLTAGTSDLANGSGFSNIPQNYSHLQLRCVFRAPSADATSGSMSVRIQFNGDGSSVYYDHNITGSGSTYTSGYNTAQPRSFIAFTAGNGNASGLFSTAIIDIIDYASTTKNKVVRSFSGADTNSTAGQIMMGSALWASTSAINNISILGDGGPSGGFGAYTQFALYGIRGA